MCDVFFLRDDSMQIGYIYSRRYRRWCYNVFKDRSSHTYVIFQSRSSGAYASRPQVQWSDIDIFIYDNNNLKTHITFCILLFAIQPSHKTDIKLLKKQQVNPNH